jgi:hypothetical protein
MARAAGYQNTTLEVESTETILKQRALSGRRFRIPTVVDDFT